MPNVTEGYGGFSYLLTFFWEFFILLLYVLNDITSSNFYKLYVMFRSHKRALTRRLMLVSAPRGAAQN